MAQGGWLFSGHTLATRVEDAEALLRRAVDSLRAAGPGRDREKKAAVDRLAARLFAARLKLLKARIVAAAEVRSKWTPGDWAKRTASVERKYATLREGGVAMNLREFGVDVGPAA